MPNKAQFIDLLAERLDGDRKRAAAALDAVIDSVYATVSKGERVAITGFGVFERRDRAARTARNPATGAAVQVPASKVPAFRPGAEFKAIASGAREFVEVRTSRAQSALDKATSAVQDAVEAVREVPGRAAAAVNPGKGKKKKDKAGKKAKKSAATVTAPTKKAAKKSPAKKAVAKKSAAKKSPAKKAAAKKTAAKKSPAKKAAAKKAAAKKAAKKSK